MENQNKFDLTNGWGNKLKSSNKIFPLISVPGSNLIGNPTQILNGLENKLL